MRCKNQRQDKIAQPLIENCIERTLYGCYRVGGRNHRNHDCLCSIVNAAHEHNVCGICLSVKVGCTQLENSFRTQNVSTECRELQIN